MIRTFTATLGDDTITLETGKLAGLAGGAVTIRSGDTMALITATAAKSAREGTDFFPLTVDFEERQYAAGRIPGSFFRREGRPSEDSILLCRLVDRPLRPLFNKGIRNDVQVIITPLSTDQEHQFDILSIIGSSAALMISDIPFNGPVGAVRIGYIDEKLVVNPTLPMMEESDLDLRIAGTADAVLMVEAGANEVPEDILLEALALGQSAYQDVIRIQEKMREEIGKAKLDLPVHSLDPAVVQAVEAALDGKLSAIIGSPISKSEMNSTIDSLRHGVMEKLAQDFEPSDLREAFDKVYKAQTRKKVLEEGVRLDGRAPKTIRPISCEVGLIPRTHGSGLFTRGETQALTLATLGSVGDELKVDTLENPRTKRFFHHYNFPPFSTGEAYRLSGPRRRSIGHGALAERALLPMVPTTDEFPYTIRLVSEVLSSNGSTSMASTCASALALMDAGVPIQDAVGGIAMGLISEGDRYVILSDIQGAEDALGDMDFKVTGTRVGITALQMDIKISGLSHEIMSEALSQAREGRLHILAKMHEAIEKPNTELSPYAPRITIIKINPEKIGTVIGPGGKMIRSIIEQTGAQIDIEDDGSVFISAPDGPSGMRAEEIVRGLTAEAEIGKIYTGKVVRTAPFGAFIEFMPGREGLVHISQLADYRVPSVEDVVQVGDEVMVMVINVDAEGKIRLSRQAVLEGWTAEEAMARDRKPSGGSGGRDRSRRGGGDSRNRRDRR